MKTIEEKGKKMNSIAKFLSQIVRSQLFGETLQAIPEGVTAEQLIKIAASNHMDYLLLTPLLQMDIPEEIKAKMRVRVFASVSRTVAQVNELKQLEKRFEEAGVVNQPMKGSIMKFIYPTPEAREMSDIDILIRGEDMDKATAILGDMGFQLLQAIKHHDIYKKAPFVIIEAHRAMYDKTVDKAQHDYFSDFSKAILREGCQYTYDFSKEDFYVYMMAHMAKHFYTMGCGIRNLVDIYIYRRRFAESMDMKYVQEQLEICGIRTFTQHMEVLADIWMEGKESTSFYNNVFEYMLNSGIYGKDENGIWNKFAEEKTQEESISRFKLKIWYFFPPLAYMAEYYSWLEEKPYLLPWAWVVRAFGGIFKKKGTHKRQMLKDISDDEINIYREIYQKMDLHFKH